MTTLTALLRRNRTATQPPGLSHLTHDLNTLVAIARTLADGLRGGTLDPLHIDNLEGTALPVIEACRWITRRRAPDAATQKKPPHQAVYLLGNLGDLELLSRSILDTLTTRPLTRATVDDLTTTYADTITALRWLHHHRDTSTADTLLADFRRTPQDQA